MIGLLIINDLPIITSIETILNELNLELKVNGKSGLQFARTTSNYKQLHCPFHTDHNASAGISLDKGVFTCFSCKRKYSLARLISILLYDQDFSLNGEQWLVKNFADCMLENREQVLSKPCRERNIQLTTNYVSDEELNKYAYYHPYMYKRYLTNDIIDEFDIGYDKDFKLGNSDNVTPCLTFPVRDLTGGTRFIARRSIKGKIYNYPANINKSDFLYGLYEDNKIFGDHYCLYVCESMFNALTLIKWGKPAVALLGTGCYTQYELLKKVNARQLVICLDNDSSGSRGTEKIKEALQTYKIIHVMRICEEKTDINDLGYLPSYEEFENKCEIT